jgi:YHS domain-containing protein
MALDVVCLMDVDENGTVWVSERKGELYYFCHPVCKDLFDQDPEVFVD